MTGTKRKTTAQVGNTSRKLRELGKTSSGKLMYVDDPTSIVRLSDPEMKPRMDALMERIRTEPGFGRSILRKAGIINRNGKLTKLYGG